MCCIGSIVTGILLGMGLLCVLKCLKGACSTRGKRSCRHKSGCRRRRWCDHFTGFEDDGYENDNCEGGPRCEHKSFMTKRSCGDNKVGCNRPGCKTCPRNVCCGSGGWKHPPGSFGHNSKLGRCGNRGCGRHSKGGASGKGGGYGMRCSYRPYGAKLCGSSGWRHPPGGFGHKNKKFCGRRSCSGRSGGGGWGWGGGGGGGRQHRSTSPWGISWGSKGLYGTTHRHFMLLSSEEETWDDGDRERIIAIHELNSSLVVMSKQKRRSSRNEI